MTFRYQYAASRVNYNLTNFTVTKDNTGDISNTGTFYISLQAANKVGYNLPSPLVAVNYVAGNTINITIEASALSPGEVVEEFIISASLTNDATQLTRLARVPGNTPLPASIELKNDDAIAIDELIATPSELPLFPVDGMIRGVSSIGSYFLYKAESTKVVDNLMIIAASTGIGRWEKVATVNTYVDVINQAPGSHVPAIAVNDDDLITPVYTYAVDGSEGSPVTFWMVNSGDFDISMGSRIGLAIYVNGDPKTKLFHGLLKVIFRGYVNTVTGAHDTKLTDGVSSMQYVDNIASFVFGKNDVLTLQKPLAPGMAFAFTVYPECSKEQLANLVPFGAQVSIDGFFFPQSSDYNPAGKLIGDYIYPVSNRRRIVPNVGLSVIALEGAGLVDSFEFPNQGQSSISGITENKEDQYIALDSNGNIYKASTIDDTVALRAIVSTKSGLTNVTTYSSTVVLTGATSGLQVQVTHPCDVDGYGIIREDYPDSIASIQEGKFNAEFVRVFIHRASSNVIYAVPDVSVTATPTQSIVINALPAAIVEALPINTDPNFGLYEPVSASLQTKAGGTFPADTYKVCVAYYHDGDSITAITHAEVNGCIPEISGSLAKVFSRSAYWAEPVANFEALRNVPVGELTHKQTRLVGNSGNVRWYQYDSAGTEADNGSTIIKPSYLTTTQAGRWKEYTVIQDIPIADENTNGVVRIVGSSAEFDKPTVYVRELIDELFIPKFNAVFENNPKAPSPLFGDDSTNLATTAWVNDALGEYTAPTANTETLGLIQMTGFMEGTGTSPEIKDNIIELKKLSNDQSVLNHVVIYTDTGWKSNPHPNAAANVSGILKLNGALTGTADNPEIAIDAVTMANIADSGATEGQAIMYSGTNWIPTTLPDASTTAKGVVQLSGVLEGTAENVLLKDSIVDLVKLNGVGTVTGNVITSTGTSWISAALPDATTATKGIIKLTGFLQGTADLPDIVENSIGLNKLQNTGADTGHYINYNGSSWISSPLPEATISTLGILQLDGVLEGTAASPQIKDKAIALSKLGNNVGTVIDEYIKFDGTSWINSPLPLASTSIKGIVQLAGDLTGTAESPQLAYEAVSLDKLYKTGVISNSVPRLNGTTNNWEYFTLEGATATTSGLIKLTGVLAGTADNPDLADGSVNVSKLSPADALNGQLLGLVNGVWQAVDSPSGGDDAGVLSVNGQTGAVVLDFTQVAVQAPYTVSNFALLSQSQEFTGNQSVKPVTQNSFVAGISIDLSQSNYFLLDLTATTAGSKTMTITGSLKSGTYIVQFKHSGNITLTFDPIFKFPGGVDPTLSTGTGTKFDIMSCVCDGTQMFCMMNKNFF